MNYDWLSMANPLGVPTQEQVEQLQERLRFLAELEQNPMWKLHVEQMEQALKTAQANLLSAKDAWEAAKYVGAAATLKDLASWLSREASTTKGVLDEASRLHVAQKSSNNASPTTPSPGDTSGAGAQT